MTNSELISAAESVLKPRRTQDGRIFGDVGAALITEKGKVYTGVCVDTPSWGLCAERSAMAAMITDGEYKIKTIVAVWRNDKTGKLHVVPPCGICRDFMMQIESHNLETEVILSNETAKPLKELLPYYQWPSSLD